MDARPGREEAIVTCVTARLGDRLAHGLLIIGCGPPGLALARRLEAAGSAVTVIEQDTDLIELARGTLVRSRIVVGDGCDPELLHSCLRQREICGVVVLLGDPERSLLAGILARSLGASTVIVLCSKRQYTSLAASHGIDAMLIPI